MSDLPEDVAGENLDNAFREFDELLERWDNRLSVENLALAERYRKAECKLGLILKIGLGGRSLVTQHYVAVFERKPGIERADCSHLRLGVVLGAYGANVAADAERLLAGRDGDQKPVFVGDVETVQTPEGVCPSLVRLHSLDQRDGADGRPLQGGRYIARAVMGGGTYWEYSVCAGRAPVVCDKGVREEIKSGSEIVNAISQDGGPFDGDRLAEIKAIDFVAGLRVYLDRDVIGVSRLESQDGRVEISKVLFGPVDLYPDAKQRIGAHGKGSQQGQRQASRQPHPR